MNSYDSNDWEDVNSLMTKDESGKEIANEDVPKENIFSRINRLDDDFFSKMDSYVPDNILTPKDYCLGCDADFLTTIPRGFYVGDFTTQDISSNEEEEDSKLKNIPEPIAKIITGKCTNGKSMSVWMNNVDLKSHELNTKDKLAQSAINRLQDTQDTELDALPNELTADKHFHEDNRIAADNSSKEFWLFNDNFLETCDAWVEVEPATLLITRYSARAKSLFLGTPSFSSERKDGGQSLRNRGLRPQSKKYLNDRHSLITKHLNFIFPNLNDIDDPKNKNIWFNTAQRPGSFYNFPVCIQRNKTKKTPHFPRKYMRFDLTAYANLMGLIVINQDGKILDCDSPFLKLAFGYMDNLIIGSHINVIIPNFSKNSESPDEEMSKNQSFKGFYLNEKDLAKIWPDSSRDAERKNHPHTQSTSFASLVRRRRRSLSKLKDNVEINASKNDQQNYRDYFREILSLKLQNKYCLDSLNRYLVGPDEYECNSSSNIQKITRNVKEGLFRCIGKHNNGSLLVIDYLVCASSKNNGQFYVWMKVGDVIDAASSCTTDQMSSFNLEQHIETNSQHDGASMSLSLSNSKVKSEIYSKEQMSAGNYQHLYEDFGALGEGAFGCVKRSCRRSDGLPTTTKFIRRDKVHSDAWVDEVPLEAVLALTLDHPNVARALDVLTDGPKFVQLVFGRQLYLKQMDLFDFVELSAGRVDESLAAHIFRQICCALAYLKNLGILHRDVKDENIIINSEFWIWLVDFGSAAFANKSNQNQFMNQWKKCRYSDWDDHSSLTAPATCYQNLFDSDVSCSDSDLNEKDCFYELDDDTSINESCIPSPKKKIPRIKMFSTFAGTIEYCSPEVLRGSLYSGHELEVWSLGVTLFTLIFGENPFYDMAEIVGSEPLFPKRMSDFFHNIVRGMLKKNPQERLTLDQVIRHPWSQLECSIEDYNFNKITFREGICSPFKCATPRFDCNKVVLPTRNGRYLTPRPCHTPKENITNSSDWYSHTPRWYQEDQSLYVCESMSYVRASGKQHKMTSITPVRHVPSSHSTEFNSKHIDIEDGLHRALDFSSKDSEHSKEFSNSCSFEHVWSEELPIRFQSPRKRAINRKICPILVSSMKSLNSNKLPPNIIINQNRKYLNNSFSPSVLRQFLETDPRVTFGSLSCSGRLEYVDGHLIIIDKNCHRLSATTGNEYYQENLFGKLSSSIYSGSSLGGRTLTLDSDSICQSANLNLSEKCGSYNSISLGDESDDCDTRTSNASSLDLTSSNNSETSSMSSSCSSSSFVSSVGESSGLEHGAKWHGSQAQINIEQQEHSRSNSSSSSVCLSIEGLNKKKIYISCNGESWSKSGGYKGNTYKTHLNEPITTNDYLTRSSPLTYCRNATPRSTQKFKTITPIKDSTSLIDTRYLDFDYPPCHRPRTTSMVNSVDLATTKIGRYEPQTMNHSRKVSAHSHMLDMLSSSSSNSSECSVCSFEDVEVYRDSIDNEGYVMKKLSPTDQLDPLYYMPTDADYENKPDFCYSIPDTSY